MRNIFGTKEKISKEYQKQLRMPSGIDAYQVGNDLLYNNAQLLDALIALIPEANYALIADVGCGPGYSLSKLALRFPCTRIIGVDPSLEMVKMAKDLNSQLIDAGRVQIIQGQSPILPLKNLSCDIILLANVIYFWNDLVANFAHLYQLLKQNGRAYVYMTDKMTLKNQIDAKDGVFLMYEKKQVLAAIKKAGFSKSEIFEVRKTIRGVKQLGYNIVAYK